MSFHNSFDKFHTIIRIDHSKKTSLLSNKTALRNKIKNHFDEKGRSKPKFFIQGSMDNNVSTGINPINEDYDIDDGVYLQNITTDDITPETAHLWVYNAVLGHTNSTVDKSKCVRVNYANNEKHVDLPIYIEEDGESYLAIKGKGWIKNKPKEISHWFKEESNEDNKGKDFRKVVRFLKAWKDKRESDNTSLELFGGFQLSILASDYFPDNYDNDLEKLFYYTVKSINENLWLHPPLRNPVDWWQDTLKYYSESRIDTFKDEFQKLYDKCHDAYNEEDDEKKLLKWQKVFGSRFPNIEKSEEKSNSLVMKIKGALLGLAHVKKPTWNMNIKGSVRISCKKSRNGMQTISMSSNQVVAKHCSLRFEAHVDGAIGSSGRKYYWQVANSGQEATNANCLRGDFYDGLLSRGGKVREETTSYGGYHFVKCYVVQNNECVAVSDPFIVNIV